MLLQFCENFFLLENIFLPCRGITVLKIRGGTEDNSKIIFLISE